MTAPTTGGGRPAKYKLANGSIVPGVTTIAGAYKDPGPLMYWSWKQGCEGKDFRDTRDLAATAGTIAHGWIDDSIHGRELRTATADDDTMGKARQAFEAFQRWRQGVSLTVIDTERPLISEIHSFGGTYDALAIVNGRISLLDWKTSSGVYPETISQLAAYRQLIRENCGSKRDNCPEEAHCLRVGKEMGDFHHHGYTSEILDAGWRRFLGSRAMWDEDRMLKRVCS